MWQNDPEFPVKVAELCFCHYDKLSKKGKPQTGKEWTLLAAIIMTTDSENDQYAMSVVAMGTGSKCLSKSKLSKDGFVVHDGHAEVIARRAFLRFLYHEVEQCYAGKDSVFCLGENKLCCQKKNIKFHMFTSNTPCGDATIFPVEKSIAKQELRCNNTKDVNCDAEEPPLKKKKPDSNDAELLSHHSLESSRSLECSGDKQNAILDRTKDSDKDQGEKCDAKISANHGKHDSTNCKSSQTQFQPESKNGGINTTDTYGEPVIYNDMNRTGAKCVPGEDQDPQKEGASYHTPGVLRTKPGRGERTLSMSCSDKIAKWNVVGIQGALLSCLINKPIYLQSITVGRCPFREDSMRRAIFERCKGVEGLSESYELNTPKFYQADVTFDHSKEELSKLGVKTVPCSASISWYKTNTGGSQEAIVNGRRLGAVAKNYQRPEARVSVCKYELLKTFLHLLKKAPSEVLSRVANEETRTYGAYKLRATEYQQSWQSLLKTFNYLWITTPREYYDFSVEQTELS